MIKLNLQNIKYIFYAIIISLLFFLGYQNIKLRNQIHNSQINISALTDSLQISKDKHNREVYSKNILIADYDELKNINSSLIEELNKSKKRNLTEIQKLNLKINNLTDSINNIKGNFKDSINNNYIYEFKDSSEYRNFKSEIIITSYNIPDSVKMNLLKDEVLADIIIKKYINNNQINLQVTSNNPYLQITNIDGSILDVTDYNKIEKPKRFSLNIGPQFGFGYIKSTQPNFGNFGFYFGIGIGISYNIKSF